MTLAAGPADTVHDRIDGLQDGPEDSFRFNPCFEALAATLLKAPVWYFWWD